MTFYDFTYMIGNFEPPTIYHEKLIKELINTDRKMGFIFVSKSKKEGQDERHFIPSFTRRIEIIDKIVKSNSNNDDNIASINVINNLSLDNNFLVNCFKVMLFYFVNELENEEDKDITLNFTLISGDDRNNTYNILFKNESFLKQLKEFLQEELKIRGIDDLNIYFNFTIESSNFIRTDDTQSATYLRKMLKEDNKEEFLLRTPQCLRSDEYYEEMKDYINKVC